MLRIGLTGGIGSGKSQVSALFQALGVPVVDADEAARAVVQCGASGLQGLVALFGASILDGEGGLNRRALRQRIFADTQARQQVNDLLHPLIRRWMDERLVTVQAPYAILSIPLLVESGLDRTVDRVLVVDLPEAQQIERVCGRDHCSASEVRSILAAQCRREVRLSVADDVIDNSAEVAALEPQVQRLHRHYLELAKRTDA